MPVKCSLCQLLNKIPTDTCFQNAFDKKGTLQVGDREQEVEAGLGVGDPVVSFLFHGVLFG